MLIRVQKNPIFLIILIAASTEVFLTMSPFKADIYILCFTAIILIIFALLIFTYFRSYFKLEREHFIYVFGFSKKAIPYSSIQKVNLSDNLTASPAWTLKRLEIVTYERSYLLSLPLQKDKSKLIETG
ncbi:PH domain-containing protein [Paenibacillus sp. 19GGS1-52]|uniref:PH domain-containing protein n=1 Tax=Paenibacillus sp. 19GGS1-52 TaxID=2758563 RepID=UPI001EFB61EF|nr:PH domain-containing protein [Paenibacillus sp. 19GGS1-52]ULO08489.1 PH domain-containing protein [Paenibacillus sp. 19GGS1-52]